MSATRPNRPYAQQGKHVRYPLLTGRLRISHAEYPLQTSANACYRPIAVSKGWRVGYLVFGWPFAALQSSKYPKQRVSSSS